MTLRIYYIRYTNVKGLVLKFYLLLPALFSSMVFADSVELTYEYHIPYAGGGQIVLINHTDNPISLSSISFNTNAKIFGSPWGSLWNWQSTIDIKTDSDQQQFQYVIHENPAVTIPAAGNAILSFNIDIPASMGPLKVAMDPSSIAVNILNASQPTTVSIEGKCQNQACLDPGRGNRIMGYLTNWSYWHTPRFGAQQMPWNKINMVSYAFSIFDNNGNVSLYDADADNANIPLISQARRKYPYLNASLSFGGWSWFNTPSGWNCSAGESPNGPALCFQQMAANSKAVDAFVKNAIMAMKEVNFNGIDIDWEYPQTADDVNHFITLIGKLRSALDEQGQLDGVHYNLSIAVSGGVDKINQLSAEQWQTLANQVDQIDVMTYDFHGAFDQGQTGSNFQSAMALDPNLDPTFGTPVLGQYNLTDALNNYLQKGVPAKKLVVGIPLYGRMMSIQSAGEHMGLYQPITGIPQGEWDDIQTGWSGLIDYQCIVDKATCGNQYNRPDLTLVQPLINNEGKYSKTPWGFNNQLFITFDDATSAVYKTNWAKNKGFLGVMLWDCSGDFSTNDKRSIISAISSAFSQHTRH